MLLEVLAVGMGQGQHTGVSRQRQTLRLGICLDRAPCCPKQVIIGDAGFNDLLFSSVKTHKKKLVSKMIQLPA